jgi:hypothetical protein
MMKLLTHLWYLFPPGYCCSLIPYSIPTLLLLTLLGGLPFTLMQTLEMGQTAQVFVTLSKRLVDVDKSKELRTQVADRSSICQAALGRYGKCPEELLLLGLYSVPRAQVRRFTRTAQYFSCTWASLLYSLFRIACICLNMRS